MIFLKNDYSEGMHPKILKKLQDTNDSKQIGYGLDEYTAKACNMIKERIEQPNADVYLLVGGTQTNLIAISSFLRPVEAIIATALGHISVHETGAIENTGHKIIEIESKNAKMTPEMIDLALETHKGEHMVVPKMVFISNSTELGNIYTLAELEALSAKCKANDLILYLDGARLGSALASEKNDVKLEDIARLCDAFYIGGTKNGAMFGEALIIKNENLKGYMRHYIKQKGGLLAKGRFLGLQFETLIENDLFIKISENANVQAKKIAEAFEKNGYELVIKQETNQVFVKLPFKLHEKLKKVCLYETFNKIDDEHIETRFVTSFATESYDVETFIKSINVR